MEALEPEQLSIAFYPAATVNSASSRLRCFGLARELAKLGYRTSFGFSLENPPDIFFVQKIVNAEVVGLAQFVRGTGGIVIYDIDDYGDLGLGSLKADAETFNRFIRLVSIVVVDTTYRQQILQREYGFSDVEAMWVIQDPIDYIGSCLPEIHSRAGSKLHGCWFGNAPNIVPALPYLLEVAKADEVADVRVLTNQDYVAQINTRFPQLATSAWVLETFPAILSSMDFCILIHDATIAGLQKSNNKMLVALALGVVPFVSRTPAYAQTAVEMGIVELVVESPREIIDRIKPKSFRAIVEKVNGEACRQELQKYYPIASAQMFSQKLMDYFAVHSRSRVAPLQPGSRLPVRAMTQTQL